MTAVVTGQAPWATIISCGAVKAACDVVTEAAVTSMMIPGCIPQTRTPSRRGESRKGLFRRLQPTSILRLLLTILYRASDRISCCGAAV